MIRHVSRQNFLKLSGAAAMGGAALLADPASIVKTLAAAPPTTLQMWIWETVPHWEKVVQLSGLKQKFPNINLQFTALDFNSLHQKLLTALTAGIGAGLPDIARTHPSFYLALVKTGAILETTKQITPYHKDIVSSRYDGMLVDGKIYGVPDDFGVYLIGYRVDLFKKAGLPTDPEQVAALWPTWADYIKVGQHLKSKLGIDLINMDPNTPYYDLIEGQGSTGNFDAQGNVIVDSPYHVQCAQIWKDLFTSGLVTTYTDGSPQFWNAHKQGKLATMVYPNWNDFTVVDFAPNMRGVWRVTRLPAPSVGVPRISATDGVQLVIPTAISSEHQQLALAVAMYLRLTVKATRAHMTSFPGAFVSYLPGLDSMRGTPSPILSDQSTYSYFLKVIQTEHMQSILYSSTHVAKADSLLQVALFNILTKNAPVAATLKQTADQLRTLQKSTGQM